MKRLVPLLFMLLGVGGCTQTQSPPQVAMTVAPFSLEECRKAVHAYDALQTRHRQHQAELLKWEREAFQENGQSGVETVKRFDSQFPDFYESDRKVAESKIIAVCRRINEVSQ